MKLKVIMDDLKSLSKNKFMIATIIAIMLIPVIYGGLYLAAFWAPYDNTEKINVAVVNLDEGYINDDKELKEYGKDIEKNLMHNDDLGWYFESDYDKAIQGLKNDKYYSIYVIPKDFSMKLERLKKGELNKPKITFIPNEKKNYINSLINQRGLSSLQYEINSKISSMFATTIINDLRLMKDGLNTGSEALFLLTEGSSELQEKIPVLQSGIEKLNEGTELLSEKLDDASDGAKKINEASASLNSKMPDLIDGANDLNDGAVLISEKLNDASDGISLLNDSLIAFQEKMPELQDSTNELFLSSVKLAESANSLKEKGGELEDAMSELNDAMDELDGGISYAKNNSLNIVNIAKDIYDERKIEADKANELVKNNLGFNASINITEKDVNDIINVLAASGQVALANDLGHDSEIISEMGEAVLKANSLLDDANKIKIDINNPDDASIEIMNILGNEIPNELMNISIIEAKLFPPMGDSVKHFSDAADFFTSIGQNEISSKLLLVKVTLENLESTLPTTNDEMIAKQKNIEIELSNYGNVLSKKLEAQALFDANLALARGLGDGSDGTNKIKDGIEKIDENMVKFVSMMDLLYKNNEYLSGGLSMLNNKIPDLEQGLAIVNDNAILLDTGIVKLKNASETLAEGTDEFSKKIPDLQIGTEMLVDGSEMISGGIDKLQSASIQLNEGTEVLNEKMPDLIDGVNELADTTDMLRLKMEDAAKEISDVVVMDSQSMGNFMAEPVKTETDELYNVENYGAGFTPYFVSLALWVGALALFIVIPIKNKSGVTATQFALTRYLIFAVIGTIQALLLSGVIIKLGLEPSNMMLFIIFNVFLSWTFIAIVQSLIYVFDDVGKLISTVWFVLQLTSCGGTFSKELTPKFFQVISPYMPFTYSVSGTREIISGINSNIFSKDIIILFAFQVIALLILTIGSKYKNYGAEKEVINKEMENNVEIKENELVYN